MQGASTLLHSLASSRSIRTLLLGLNPGVTSEKDQALANMLRLSRHLTLLDLSNSHMSTLAAVQLASGRNMERVLSSVGVPALLSLALLFLGG
jgi:hypothetical protein